MPDYICVLGIFMKLSAPLLLRRRSNYRIYVIIFYIFVWLVITNYLLYDFIMRKNNTFNKHQDWLKKKIVPIYPFF